MLDSQERLKHALQATKPADVENLVAALCGKLLNVPVAVARTGFQHGGDAGPAGRNDRYFRLECKRYADSSNLDRRELLGEIDHALARDEALEAWILIATQAVPEQVAQDLTQHGQRLGVPVLIMDCPDQALGYLSALCASAPDLVETLVSKDAAVHARALQPVATRAIGALRNDLQSWCLGFAGLRVQSHARLQKIWSSPHESHSVLSQDAAGGMRTKRVRRASIHQALTDWWGDLSANGAPAAVVGSDGVGKTWAALDWLVDRKDLHPIIVTVPASAATSVSPSETSVKEFLADRLYEFAAVRDRAHWLRRLDRLLRRPVEEGPVLTVLLDGLNQEPSAPWLQFLKVVQGERFAGRVRVVLTTRTFHFNDRLKGLRNLIDRPRLIAVGAYGTEPGGELDRMLAFESLTQEDLRPDLIELASRPRLFNLVIRFRDRLVEAGQITVHRLLWEYGRDTLGERAGSFSDSEWQAWLKEIAQKYREGIRQYTLRSLSETAARHDLTCKEVSARLSDIVDGRFAVETSSASWQLTPTVVAHALGAGLVWQLSNHLPQTFASLDAEIAQWLDPISGLDQRAEILRAAVSIVVEQGLADSDVAGVLLTAWLQTQNISEKHRNEIADLAPALAKALLDAVEQSSGSARSSARYWAIKCLRAVPRNDTAVRDRIVERASRWLRVISRDVELRPDAAEMEKRRSERLQQRIGADVSGPRSVIGVRVELVDHDDDVLQVTISSLIDGYPLAPMLSIFELAAVALAVRRRSKYWDELKWLCFLNEIDPEETAAGLRRSSQEILQRAREPGVHADLPRRVAAVLLRLTGELPDEEEAAALEPDFDRALTYESDYLPNPGRSFFALERRHATVVLRDTELSLHVRIQRTTQLWLDPMFEAPAEFVAELEAAAASIDVDKLDRTRGRTIEDIRFEELEPVLARCAPHALADLLRRKLRGITSCASDSRLCSAHAAVGHLIIATPAEARAARILRSEQKHPDDHEESFAASRFLMIEVKDLDAFAQFDALIRADLTFVLKDFIHLLRRPTRQDVDTLVARYGAGSSLQQETLLALLSAHPSELSDMAWQWVDGFAQNLEHRLRPLAFSTLGRADPDRLGRQLWAAVWSWRASEKLWVNHYGSHALIKASRTQSFDEVVPRLAPWCLLAAARERGADPAEVRLAARILGHVLEAETIEEPDLGSGISVEGMEQGAQPFAYSVEVCRSPDEDLATAFKAAFDFDGQIKEQRRAEEVARVRLDEARSAGASLLLVNMEVEDLALVWEHAPEMFERWLDGYREPTLDFRRRVRLAETAYLAMCEVLLTHDPARGVPVWRALRETIATHYIGAAEVDDLTHMVFRAPPSEPVTNLRTELLSVQRTHTDAALCDLALAALYNGHAEWLHAVITTDLASPRVWRQRRGLTLAGFTTNNTLPVEGAWPESPIRTGYAELRCQSAKRRALDACARHWWREYMATDSPEHAYAAWILFTRSADRRALVWMQEDFSANEQDSFLTLKLAHAELNRSQRQRFARKRGEKWEKKFLGRDVGEGLGPWIG